MKIMFLACIYFILLYCTTTGIYIGLDLLPTTLDAAWALFLAMHESEEQLAVFNSNMSEFAYNSPDHAQIIYSNILKQQFYGRSVFFKIGYTCIKYLFNQMFKT